MQILLLGEEEVRQRSKVVAVEVPLAAWVAEGRRRGSDEKGDTDPKRQERVPTHTVRVRISYNELPLN